MRTSNPTFVEWVADPSDADKMTLAGTASKLVALLGVMAISFFYVWSLSTSDYSAAYHNTGPTADLPTSIDIPPKVIGLTALGCLGGFLVALVVIFRPKTAPFLAPVYAGLEGLALGAISAGFEAKYPGVVMQAMTGTFTSLGVMAILYSTGVLRPTRRFASYLLAAMLGVLALYTVDIVMGFFGGYVPPVHEGGVWGILLSVAVVLIASLCFIIDFGEIEGGVSAGAPRYMEWYGAFSIMVTLVWLYLEMLRLIVKVRSGD